MRQAHLPGFLQSYERFKELNVDVIAFVSVSDTFVMSAWGKDQNVEDKVGHRYRWHLSAVMGLSR